MNLDENSYADGMPDSDLDRLLAAANENLLAHIKAAADATPTLTALISRATPKALTDSDGNIIAIGRDTDRTPAVLAIGIRSNVRRLTSYLNRALIFTNNLNPTLACALDLAHDIDLGLARGADRADNLDLALGLARGVGRAADFARIAEYALDRTLEIDRARARDLARVRGLDYVRVRDRARIHERIRHHGLVHDLVCDLVRIRVLVHDRTRAHDLDRDLDLDLKLDLARHVKLARDLVRYLNLALDRARDLGRDLGTHQVDASDADLSDADIHDLHVLDGVIWTLGTTWPPELAQWVRSESREIRPGVYQVGRGNDPERLALESA